MGRATSYRLRVGFKHEDAGAWVGDKFDENEPTGKIHVYQVDGEGRTVVGVGASLWGSITAARALAEVIGAEFYDY